MKKILGWFAAGALAVGGLGAAQVAASPAASAASWHVVQSCPVKLPSTLLYNYERDGEPFVRFGNELWASYDRQNRITRIWQPDAGPDLLCKRYY